MDFIIRIIKVVFTRGFGALSALFVTYSITQAFSQSSAGVVLFAISVIAMLGQLLPFGSEIYSMRVVGAKCDKSWSVINHELSSIIILFIIINALVIFSILLVDKYLSFRVFSSYRIENILLFVYLAGSSLAFIQIISRAFIGLGEAVWASVLQSLLGPAFFLISFYISDCFVELEIFQIVVIYSLCFITAAIIAILSWFRLSYSSLVFHIKISSDMKRSLITLGTISTVTVIVQYSTQILSVFYLSPEEIASFNVSRRISLLVSFILIAVNLIQAPKYASAFELNNFREINRIALVSGKVLMLVAILVFCFVMIFSEHILGLFGDNYKQDTAVLLILMIGQSVNVVTGSVMFILNMTHNEKYVLRVTLLMAPLAVISTLFFSKEYGLVGAAVVTSVLVSVQNLTYVVIIKRKLGFNTLNIFRTIH